jgi:hypothetical protein
MKRFSRLFLTVLATLVSLTMLLFAPHALAQGPVDGQNEAADTQPRWIPVPELESGNDPFAETPLASLASPPSQGVPEAEAQLVPEPLLPGSDPAGNQPAGNVPSADAPFGLPPAATAPTTGAPTPGAQPAVLDDLLSGLEPQIRAALGAMGDQLLEQLNGWLHQEADQVSISFNRWLHQEVDRLFESFNRWLTEQLRDMGDAGTVELKPAEG